MITASSCSNRVPLYYYYNIMRIYREVYVYVYKKGRSFQKASPPKAPKRNSRALVVVYRCVYSHLSDRCLYIGPIPVLDSHACTHTHCVAIGYA